MLLTIATTHRQATDLGYLLAKHPDRCQTFSLAYGKAHVFYPEAGEDRCTAALLLDLDPVGFVRGRRSGRDTQGTLARYVNDRPYSASSFLSVAIAQVFTSAMKSLVREALERLMAGDDPEADLREQENAHEEAALERPISLNDQRIGAVLAVLQETGSARVLDLGCGEGKLLGALLEQKSVAKVTGVDVSMRSLERSHSRLRLDRMPEMRRERVELVQASATYRDKRFSDCDAACAIEVMEHSDASRLGAFERVLFEFAQPPNIVRASDDQDATTCRAGSIRSRGAATG
jgi:SAM-dependent methyltransferase